MKRTEDVYRCDFCGKSKDEVTMLIKASENNSVCICNDCVLCCGELVMEKLYNKKVEE